jgi:hypothetical protein
MNTAETALTSSGLASEDGALQPSFSWNDWFHFDESEQKCVFKSSTSLPPTASARSEIEEPIS